LNGIGVHEKQVKRAALYVRVSTDAQTVENQMAELSRVAEHRGWEVVEIYRDAGISGAKGRDKRPGLDGMPSCGDERDDQRNSEQEERVAEGYDVGLLTHAQADRCAGPQLDRKFRVS
jgi:hypothetical protein